MESLYNIIMGDMKNQLQKAKEKEKTLTDEKEKETMGKNIDRLEYLLNRQFHR